MLLSYNWLKQFVPIKIAPVKLAELLTLHCFEVEKVSSVNAHSGKIIVGQIKKITNHPNAQKLQLVSVDIGKENLEIVCGAFNIKVGDKVPVALTGAKLPNGLVISQREVRGAKSQGMLCAADELQLGQDHLGIMILEKGTKVGQSLSKALGIADAIIEVDNKSLTHRPDLWSHYGVAREIAALTKTKLKPFSVRPQKSVVKTKKEKVLEITVADRQLCPRYLAVVMDNIKIEPSPAWLSQRLDSLGIRSINNIVDVTNYVMLELGQPMHAFDFNKVLNKKLFGSLAKIIVRRAQNGERIVTLDGKTRILDEETLVIANSQEAIALAGVMGGINSEIDENSKIIILESANFNPINIRKTSAKLNLRSESSARFEKGLDPNLAAIALQRAMDLIGQINPGARQISLIQDKKHFKLNLGPIAIDVGVINKKIGQDLNKKEIIKILNRLDFKVKASGEKLKVLVPTWRATGDINIAEDIIEEVARIYGYNKITSRLPQVKIGKVIVDSLLAAERKAKQLLAQSAGMTEVNNYIFWSADQAEKLGYKPADLIKLANPISTEAGFLRRNLLGNLILSAEMNLKNFDQFSLFESGSVFCKEKGRYLRQKKGIQTLPNQPHMIAAILAIKDKTSVASGACFYGAKSAAVFLLEQFGLNDYSFSPKISNQKFWHPARSLAVLLGNLEVGVLGEIHPQILEQFGIEVRLGAFELNLLALANHATADKTFRQLNRYPAVARDLSFIVDKNVLYQSIIAAIQKIDPVIKKIELIDAYQSEKIGRDKKSLTLRFIYQSDQQTLTAESVEEIHTIIGQSLAEKFSAQLRV